MRKRSFEKTGRRKAPGVGTVKAAFGVLELLCS
jgi:hypothetical protein